MKTLSLLAHSAFASTFRGGFRQYIQRGLSPVHSESHCVHCIRYMSCRMRLSNCLEQGMRAATWAVAVVHFNGTLQRYTSTVHFNGTLQRYTSTVHFNFIHLQLTIYSRSVHLQLTIYSRRVRLQLTIYSRSVHLQLTVTTRSSF